MPAGIYENDFGAYRGCADGNLLREYPDDCYEDHPQRVPEGHGTLYKVLGELRFQAGFL